MRSDKDSCWDVVSVDQAIGTIDRAIVVLGLVATSILVSYGSRCCIGFALILLGMIADLARASDSKGSQQTISALTEDAFHQRNDTRPFEDV